MPNQVHFLRSHPTIVQTQKDFDYNLNLCKKKLLITLKKYRYNSFSDINCNVDTN